MWDIRFGKPAPLDVDPTLGAAVISQQLYLAIAL